jgi:phosphoglycerate dehydrogenase-like enzyme
LTSNRADAEPADVLPVSNRPIIVVEDDPFTRIAQIVLDPATSDERRTAFADFVAHDEPDFDGWCARLRERVEGLYPAEIRMATSTDDMRAQIADCRVLLVESLTVDRDTISAAGRLEIVQKYGTILRNIDVAACAEMGVKVLRLRRRANISCAEHAFGLMLTLARKLHRLNGLVSVERMTAAGLSYRPFDRRHTPNGNYARIPGLAMLNESTIGIIGLGEIGREIALRASAFGMHVLYHQRARVAEAEEDALNARYVTLDDLLAHSDWIVPQAPTGPGTRNLIDHRELQRIKPGARLVNVSNAQVVNREAVIEALKSGQLAGFALDTFYEEPARNDDELLSFDNVILTGRMGGSPRFNALKDFEELITGLAREVST